MAALLPNFNMGLAHQPTVTWLMCAKWHFYEGGKDREGRIVYLSGRSGVPEAAKELLQAPEEEGSERGLRRSTAGKERTGLCR